MSLFLVFIWFKWTAIVHTDACDYNYDNYDNFNEDHAGNYTYGNYDYYDDNKCDNYNADCEYSFIFHGRSHMQVLQHHVFHK